MLQQYVGRSPLPSSPSVITKSNLGSKYDRCGFGNTHRPRIRLREKRRETDESEFTIPNMRNETQTQNKSQYELSRDERIKANLERMQKLGIADISLELKSQFQAKRATKSFSNRTTPSCGPSPIRKPGPVRRSSR